VRTAVIAFSAASWVFAVFLMGYYGRKHILRILRGQLST